MEDLAAISERRLRTAGIRITPQRKLILGILARAEDHLDAHEIYEQGRRQEPRLSLSTVYRTLGLLKETGVVCELHLDSDHHHYELESKEKHAHLVCLGCGQVIEVDSTAFAEAALAVGEAHGFEVSSSEIELSGYCADCRQRGQP
jgi:Fur family ferric uptake transcriptional regulator